MENNVHDILSNRDTQECYNILTSDPRAYVEACQAANNEYPAHIKWIVTMFYEFHKTPETNRIDLNRINFPELFKKLLGEENEK